MIPAIAAPDPASETPLHRQVYTALRARILEGTLRPGDKLPPTRVLAQELSLARATIAEAYEQLRSEGYVESRTGAGTFVTAGIARGACRPEAALPPLRLSSWGEGVAAFAADPDVDAAECIYDLRPHAIAADAFPWDAWQASVDAALKHDRGHLLRYPAAAGLRRLREVVAHHLRRYRAVRCEPEQVIIVNGAQQGLNLVADILLDPADLVAVEDPGYPSARLVFETRGMHVRRIAVDDEGLQVSLLSAAAPPRLIHVTPSHQDPTGVTLSLSRRLALLQFAAEVGSVVVEDDYDSEYRYEGDPVESLQSLDETGHVIYMGSFSKSVLPGLRIGYMVVPPSLVPALEVAKAVRDSGAPALDQAALVHFIESGEYERHIRRMRRLYRGRRDALVNALAGAFGTDITIGRRHGGLNMLVTFHIGSSAAEITDRALSAGLALRSVDGYHATPPAEPTFLIGFGAIPAEVAPQIAATFRAAIPDPISSSLPRH